MRLSNDILCNMQFFIFIFIGSVITSIDLISKAFAKSFLWEPIELIPGWFSLSYHENIGVAFSFPITWIPLKVLTLLLIFWIFVYYVAEERKKKKYSINIAYACIIGWALGNAWERIVHGYVVDFFALEYFAVFNIADASICLGALLLAYCYYKK